MLLELIDEHRGAFEYDWRSRFGLGVDSIPGIVGWDEASRHLDRLMSDPSSHLAAAVTGWSYPIDRAALVVMDLYDLQHKIGIALSGSKRKPKPYPRPWPELTKTVTKPAPEVTQEQIVAALRFAGHMGPVPAI